MRSFIVRLGSEQERRARSVCLSLFRRGAPTLSLSLTAAAAPPQSEQYDRAVAPILQSWGVPFLRIFPMTKVRCGSLAPSNAHTRTAHLPRCQARPRRGQALPLAL